MHRLTKAFTLMAAVAVSLGLVDSLAQVSEASISPGESASTETASAGDGKPLDERAPQSNPSTPPDDGDALSDSEGTSSDDEVSDDAGTSVNEEMAPPNDEGAPLNEQGATDSGTTSDASTDTPCLACDAESDQSAVASTDTPAIILGMQTTTPASQLLETTTSSPVEPPSNSKERRNRGWIGFLGLLGLLGLLQAAGLLRRTRADR